MTEKNENPLAMLRDFLRREQENEQAKRYNELRLVGYVLNLSYARATIITSDRFKEAVGGLPRNSLLLMVPRDFERLPLHFTVLRVLDAAETPLERETAQTYFELQKRSMPELDVFTQNELQWGALETAVLGMYYENPDYKDRVEYSGDINNFVSAHKYNVYSPTSELLNLMLTTLVPIDNRFTLGYLRLTECRLQLPSAPTPADVPVLISTDDFMGARTALFGKTRLGKSNTIKLIAASMIDTTKTNGRVGQLIFDNQGEYANDNPQDDSSSLASAYPDQCVVYALTPKEGTSSRPLKLNFYEHPERSHQVLKSLVSHDQRHSIYIQAFGEAKLPPIEDLDKMEEGDKKRARRRILMYWAILRKAGFEVDESALKDKLKLDPGYHKDFRDNLYSSTQPAMSSPPRIETLSDVLNEFERIARFIRGKEDSHPDLLSSGGSSPLFQRDERALLEFLVPSGVGAGPAIVQVYRKYHDKKAGNFAKEILEFLNKGKTVILDLGNADQEVMEYFSSELTNEIFSSQVEKFTTNKLGDKFVQLYFEEAHNLFPRDEKATKDIYLRIAKEGAKYHIGMVYSTQSVTSINPDLLNQTENFFIAHMSSIDEVNALGRINVAYETMKEDILQTKTQGYMRMLTRSHRFVVPVQMRKFTPNSS